MPHDHAHKRKALIGTHREQPIAIGTHRQGAKQVAAGAKGFDAQAAALVPPGGAAPVAAAGKGKKPLPDTPKAKVATAKKPLPATPAPKAQKPLPPTPKPTTPDKPAMKPLPPTPDKPAPVVAEEPSTAKAPEPSVAKAPEPPAPAPEPKVVEAEVKDEVAPEKDASAAEVAEAPAAPVEEDEAAKVEAMLNKRHAKQAEAHYAGLTALVNQHVTKFEQMIGALTPLAQEAVVLRNADPVEKGWTKDLNILKHFKDFGNAFNPIFEMAKKDIWDMGPSYGKDAIEIFNAFHLGMGGNTYTGDIEAKHRELAQRFAAKDAALRNAALARWDYLKKLLRRAESLIAKIEPIMNRRYAYDFEVKQAEKEARRAAAGKPS